MSISVTRRFTFEAAHKLPDYNGACANLHGHTYTLEVTVTAVRNISLLNDTDDYPLKKGMVIDFKLLKEIVTDSILSKVDHQYLNDLFSNPTAEIMAVDFFNTLSFALAPHDVALIDLKLWETKDSYAEVSV